MSYSSLTVSRRPRVGWLIASLFALLLVFSAPLAASAQTADDERAFSDTGFRIADDAIWSYFSTAGGEATFGAPISRAFQLRGVTVQLFQRAVLEIKSDGSVSPVALMTEDWLPYTGFNGSVIPAADSVLAMVTPKVDQPAYETRLRTFVSSYVPNTYEGRPVNFLATLQATGGEATWGAPTSAAVADPSNPNFVYQRFERGVLMFDGESTSWMLMGDALKSVMTGSNLPVDLADETATSTLRARTDLAGAFTPDA